MWWVYNCFFFSLLYFFWGGGCLWRGSNGGWVYTIDKLVCVVVFLKRHCHKIIWSAKENDTNCSVHLCGVVCLNLNNNNNILIKRKKPFCYKIANCIEWVVLWNLAMRKSLLPMCVCVFVWMVNDSKLNYLFVYNRGYTLDCVRRSTNLYQRLEQNLDEIA